MRGFTDLFIKRPVLALVVSLLILMIGLRAITGLSVEQFPRSEEGEIIITTTYPGADPNVVAGFITTPIENAVSQVNGIDYMTSTSQSSVSNITINLRLNYDADKALTEISAKVNSILNQLPIGTQQPVLVVMEGQLSDVMYMAFQSPVLSQTQATDYLTRVVQPQLQAVPGVQIAEVLGAQNYAMRIWINPDKLAALGLTAHDVYAALGNNDFISALGNTKGQMTQVTLTASTNLHTPEEFQNLIVKQVNGVVVRLKDVATVELGADSYDQYVSFNNKGGVFIGIRLAPGANLLTVLGGIRKIFPSIQQHLPHGITGNIVFDATDFVNASIHDVIFSLIEALIIVTLVVFAFLGSPRSVLIPVIAIPLSLIGAFGMMLAFGFTINLLTLLALVLAIGLVVDDAIIVVENVNRHIDDGEPPFAATLAAARELAGPIVAMTIVLIAVYVPIGLQSGLTGALFTQFAFTLAGAVTISAIVALTLTPMMSSRILKRVDRDHPNWEGRLISFIDRRFAEIHRIYMRMLQGALGTIPVIAVFAVIIFVSIYFLVGGSKSELAPAEDQGFLGSISTPAPDATVGQDALWLRQMTKLTLKHKPVEFNFSIVDDGVLFSGIALTPWDQRSISSMTLQTQLQQEYNAGVAGQKIVVFQPPSLPGSSGLPFSFVIKSTGTVDQLYPISRQIIGAALSSGKFIFLDNDLKIDQPQATVVIDRAKTAALGLSMADVGAALSQALGGDYVNYFSLYNRSYQVIPQVQRSVRLNVGQIGDYTITAPSGIPVPLSSVAKIVSEVIPESINHFQQQNAATIAGVVAPGVAQSDALQTMRSIAAKYLPASGYTIDYAGPLRQYVQETNGFVLTFGFAVVIIFLALAALFNSFRDPFIILVSVPMSIAGAMIFIYLGFGGLSLNIYTQVGLVTLMGLVSKHGILMTEVANEARAEGRSKRDAIVYAAGIRFRPILMTTTAMVLGVMPLILASGAGAASRRNMGVVIGGGLAIGTLFTLFVVPAVYILVSSGKRPNAPTHMENEPVPPYEDARAVPPAPAE